MATKSTHIIDATGLTLGRLASQAAILLRGKNQPDFTPHLDSEATVKITNAGKLTITGRKLQDKIYLRHSGYPGGQKKATMAKIVATKGQQEIIKLAVQGMLPANRLRAKFMKRLLVEE